jgi:triacylglycerol lipase
MQSPRARLQVRGSTHGSGRRAAKTRCIQCPVTGWCAALVLLLLAACAPLTTHAAECVVTLHGLGRTRLSMALLASRLEDAGYAVHNIGYPSRSAPIEMLAAVVGEGLAACRRDGHRQVHFVTHSLGGILVRTWLQRGVPADLGRVVMLAPPNHGSAVVDRARDATWFRWFTGPAGQALGTGDDALPGRLAPLAVEIGVIAGTAVYPVFSAWIPGPDDGLVAVDSVRLEGMRDFLVVRHGHTFIMNSREVARQTIAFLRAGAFERAKMPR